MKLNDKREIPCTTCLYEYMCDWGGENQEACGHYVEDIITKRRQDDEKAQ